MEKLKKTAGEAGGLYNFLHSADIYDNNSNGLNFFSAVRAMGASRLMF
jgi:hypothetical protein